MKKRFFEAIKKHLIILSVLLAYLIWILITDIKIPCLVYELTSFQCPGCGMTRMVLSLLKLDFKSAFSYNPFILVTSPIILLCLIYPDVNYIKNGKYDLGKLSYLLYAEVAGLVIFGILRNFI